MVLVSKNLALCNHAGIPCVNMRCWKAKLGEGSGVKCSLMVTDWKPSLVGLTCNPKKGGEGKGQIASLSIDCQQVYYSCASIRQISFKARIEPRIKDRSHFFEYWLKLMTYRGYQTGNLQVMEIRWEKWGGMSQWISTINNHTCVSGGKIVSQKAKELITLINVK